jgi:hypothetical protein
LLSFWYAPSDRLFYPKALLQPYAQWLAEAGIPPRGRELARTDNRCPFCAACACIVRVHQNVRVDEIPIAHGARHGKSAASIPDRTVAEPRHRSTPRLLERLSFADQ